MQQSGTPGSSLVCQLPQAFRRLPRPSIFQRQDIPHVPFIDWPPKSRTQTAHPSSHPENGAPTRTHHLRHDFDFNRITISHRRPTPRNESRQAGPPRIQSDSSSRQPRRKPTAAKATETLTTNLPATLPKNFVYPATRAPNSQPLRAASTFPQEEPIN